MKNNNINLVTLLSTFSILVIGTLLTTLVYGQEENVTDHVPKFFAIQHAQSGSISEINSTVSSLELNDVSDKTILFSDRPDRIVKSITTSNFIENWSSEADSFSVDPPNAALTRDNQEKQDIIIIELSEPVYNYDANILVYNFNDLNNTIEKLPNEFGKTTILIDEFHFGPNPGDG
ncbi:MAG: hypothetical protein ACPKPY_01350 [Nitrososphaeraceae archaeon]